MSDGFVVTPHVKGQFTKRLREQYNCTVYAFGDSPMDLDMLKIADHCIVVVGAEESRSNSMDRALKAAMTDNRWKLRQVLLPKTVTPRMDAESLPIIELADANLLRQIKSHRTKECRLDLIDATECYATKLLIT